MLYSFTLGTFISLDGHKIVKNRIIKSYKDWKQLNNLVSSQYKNVFAICWYSLVMINKALYLSFIQYMNNSVRKLDNKVFEVSYIINGKIYKIWVQPKKGPSLVLQVSDENQEDITDEIIPYLGPCNNWHGRLFSSKDFKKKSLTFELSNGEERTFEDGDSFNLD